LGWNWLPLRIAFWDWLARLRYGALNHGTNPMANRLDGGTKKRPIPGIGIGLRFWFGLALITADFWNSRSRQLADGWALDLHGRVISGAYTPLKHDRRTPRRLEQCRAHASDDWIRGSGTLTIDT